MFKQQEVHGHCSVRSLDSVLPWALAIPRALHPAPQLRVKQFGQLSPGRCLTQSPTPEPMPEGGVYPLCPAVNGTDHHLQRTSRAFRGVGQMEDMALVWGTAHQSPTPTPKVGSGQPA